MRIYLPRKCQGQRERAFYITIHGMKELTALQSPMSRNHAARSRTCVCMHVCVCARVRVCVR